MHLRHQSEFERLAADIRRRARVGDTELPLASAIAVRLLGPEGFAYGHPAAGARLDGHRIVVPKNHPDQNFVIAHELGEWALKYVAKFKGAHREKEAAANRIGSAIIAPKAAVEAAYRRYGEDVDTLSRAFVMSRTAVVLRLAELRNEERGVVTRLHRNVIVRNARAVNWSDPRIVDVAIGTRRTFPGLVKTHAFAGGIDDGRVAFRAK